MNARGAFTIRTAATAHFIHLTVADTGCGMDPETRQRVFEPFFSTRQANGGHGLGLETVKSMAEAHRATVDLDTAPGEGTTFTIGFPLAALTMAASAASR
jgi:signal transduction histidine kinase